MSSQVEVITRSGRKVRRPVRFEEEDDEPCHSENNNAQETRPGLRRRTTTARRLDTELLLATTEQDEQRLAETASSALNDSPGSADDLLLHNASSTSLLEQEDDWQDEDYDDYADELYYQELENEHEQYERQRRRRRVPYYHLHAPTAWLLPADHPAKLVWDVLTVVLSCINVYGTHRAIRDRQFGHDAFSTFCDVWFVLDVLWNFLVQRPIGGNVVLKDWRSVWGRYLTTWFVVDALALVPGEVLYVQPLIEVQNRRGLLKKSVFRTRAVLRVTSALRGRHFRWFGQVAKHSKQAGMGGASRLLRLLIKYVPKYLLFFRNMKAVVAVRCLRQVHWLRKVFWKRPFWSYFAYWKGSKSSTASSDGKNPINTEDETNSLTSHDDEVEDELYPRRYSDWEFVDDEDDGDPY